MRNRTPVPRDDRADLPDFTPVPRLKHRHDGWTPERQRAFIEALADTGSVSRAAGQVNMAQANCYTLRRAPGAEGFRAAWEAALDCGIARLKDIAFERALDGQLVPVFRAGKLVGYSRKRNDALLMFCLRHYGQDPGGRRTTINYFSTRASAGAGAGTAGPDGQAAAEASTTTVRTTISGGGGSGGGDAPGALAREAAAAQRIEDFAGVALDAEAGAAIEDGGDAELDALTADPDEAFVPASATGFDWGGDYEPPVRMTDWVPFVAGESPWEMTGADLPDWAAARREGQEAESPPSGSAPPPALAPPPTLVPSLPADAKRPTRTARLRKAPDPACD